ARFDRAALVAGEGVRLDDSPATRGNLLATLLRSPAALAVLPGHDTQVLDQALSREGTRLVTRGDDDTVSFFDTRSLREVGHGFNVRGQPNYCGALARPV